MADATTALSMSGVPGTLKVSPRQLVNCSRFVTTGGYLVLLCANCCEQRAERTDGSLTMLSCLIFGGCPRVWQHTLVKSKHMGHKPTAGKNTASCIVVLGYYFLGRLILPPFPKTSRQEMRTM